MTKKCVICGTEFEAKRADAEVCSPACRQKNWRNKKEQEMSVAGISAVADLPKENKTEVTFNGPQLLPDWAKKIEDYCGTTGITPEELIEQHAKKVAKPTRPDAAKPSDDQKEAAKFVARGMSNYDLERRKKKNGF